MLARLFLLSLVFPFLFGCGNVWRRSSIIADVDNFVVETEILTTSGNGKPKNALFSHPAHIPAKYLARFLSKLQYEAPALLGKPTVNPVFSETDIDKLADAISKGLSRNGPSERVRFLETIKHPKIKIFTEEKTTRGVAFVQPEGILNLAFDLVDDKPEKDRYEQMFDTNWEDPTLHTISDVHLKLPKGAFLFIDSKGKERSLWVTVSIRQLLQQKLPLEKPVKTTKTSTGKSQSHQAAPANKKPTVQKQKAAIDDHEVISRLKYLDELLKKKTITKEQYDKEKEDIFRNY